MADIMPLPKWVERYYQDYYNKLEAVRALFDLHYKKGIKNG